MQDRVFRALLWLLPREFRDAYARDMEATFRVERRDAGSAGRLLRLWFATAVDVLRAAPAHHWDVLTRDLRFAARAMTARPLHTLTAIATLALGLGASIGMFAVIDAVWLQPLPYRDARQLVSIGETSNGGQGGPSGYLTFLDVRANAKTLSSIAAASQSTATMTGDGRDAERINIMRASSNYLEMVGVAPALGRWLTDAEDRPGAARRVIVLSDALWARRFNRDPSVINRIIQVNGVGYTVVGVMPAGFKDLVAARLYQSAEMWTPLGYDPAASFACRTCRHLRVFGRLAPGRSPADAERELTTIVLASASAHPTEYHNPGVAVVRFSEMFFGPVRQTLLVLAIGVVLLLFVACGNVANLLLLRASEREHEVAVRIALGVTVARLARQLVTESILLALLGGFAGLPLAWALVRVFTGASGAAMPRLDAAAIDGRTVLVALTLVVVSGLLFGLVPLSQLRRRTLSSGMQGAGRRTAGAGTWRFRSLLIGGNMAMAAVLLVGSGLLVRSLVGLLALDLGFDPRQVLTMQISLSGPAYSTPDNAPNIAATSRFYDDALEKVRRLPGVKAAAGVTTLPMSGQIDGYGLHVVGRPLANPEAAPGADRFVVTPDYFAAMRMPLVAGRLLDATDRQGGAAVAVVNDVMAGEIFPGEDAIGHQIVLGSPNGPPRTIVGVVGSVRHRALDAAPGNQVYVPQAQWVWAETDLTLVVRAAGDPEALAAPIRQIMRQIDPLQPVTGVRTYDDVLSAASATRRVAAQLLGIFAAAAFLLAMVGLYGALGVAAQQRQREMGVRMALGARASEIARLVMRQGLRPAVAGLLAGLAIAAASVSAIRTLLFGVRDLDPATFGGASAVLLAAACLACAIPAWRASRANPVTALRAD